MSSLSRRLFAAPAFVAALAIAAALRAADPPPAGGAARPLLKQLNQETESLYREIQAGVVRVQLPPPKWAGAPLVEQDNPVHKWGDRLSSDVRKQLEEEQRDASQGRARRLTASIDTASAATTRPASQPNGKRAAAGAWTVSNGENDTLVFRPNGANAGALKLDAGGGIAPDGQFVAGGHGVDVSVTPAGSFTPNNIGLLLDGEGHVLVPICVEKESIDPQGVRVMVGPGQMTTARFVGSDRQTNLTVLKLDKPMGIPVRLAAARPQEGTLTMFLAPNSGVGRLMIWTNELKDWGVVVNLDGAVYGFTRQGQFLAAAACKPTVDQLVAGGAVRRAKIGLALAEVPQHDPARESDAALGTQPAVRVNEIAENSPAAGAGLQVGDLILQLNDQPVGDPHSFAAAIGQPDSKTSVKLLRAGREQTLTIDSAKDR